MKKALLFIIAVLAISLVFSGCGIDTRNNGEEGIQKVQDSIREETNQINEEPGSTGTDREEGHFPLSAKDAKGADITVEKKPENIVSLTLGTDEMLLAMVDKSRIKGITYLSEDPGLSNIVDLAKNFPVKLKGEEVELLISLQPDIVFVADWTDEKIIQQLRDANINVYAYKTPNGIEEQKQTILEIARLVGEVKKGEEIIKSMDDKLLEVESKIKTLTEEEKLTALSLDSFFYTYGTNTTFDDLASRSGIINLAAKEGIDGWQQLSKEKVVEMNPDVIFLPAWSYQGFDADKFSEDFKNDKSLAGINAVKNNRVFMLNEAHTTTISQNIVLGVEDMAKAVYPELFK
jgi:iron complex transport system substrate-binding protein